MDAQLPRGPNQAPPDRLQANPQTLACIGLILLVGTDIFSLVMGGGGIGGPKLLCYLSIFLLCGLHAGTLTRGALASPPLVLLVGLACISAVWSIDTSETLRRLTALLACTCIGILVGRGHSLRGLVLFFALLATATAWCSLIAIAGFPEARGTPPWDSTWRGIFNHKNGLGAAMAIGLPFALYAAIVTRGLSRKLFASGFAVSLLLLVASESRTSQIIGVLSVANLLIGIQLRSRKLGWSTVTLVVFGCAIGLVAFLFATGLTDQIFAALGRKPTMSGRIPLWTLSWPYIMDRPILGYGFAAFWDPDSDRVLMMAMDPDLRFAPFYSHNGLVETLLALGASGAMVVAWLLLSAFHGVVRILKLTRRVDDLVPILVFLISFCLLNVTESSVLQRDDLIWIVFVATVIQIAALRTSVEPRHGVRMSRGGAGSAPGRFRHNRGAIV